MSTFVSDILAKMISISVSFFTFSFIFFRVLGLGQFGSCSLNNIKEHGGGGGGHISNFNFQIFARYRVFAGAGGRGSDGRRNISNGGYGIFQNYRAIYLGKHAILERLRTSNFKILLKTIYFFQNLSTNH